MSRTRTGLLAPATRVAAPEYTVRLTVPARELLQRTGNRVEIAGADVRDVTLWQVTLTGLVPVDGGRPALEPVLVEGPATREQHAALRIHDEPPYPGEWPVAWWERGEWVPCPVCQHALVWYEAGYVPGYRVCTQRPHHHALLSDDGRRATRVQS